MQIVFIPILPKLEKSPIPPIPHIIETKTIGTTNIFNIDKKIVPPISKISIIIL